MFTTQWNGSFPEETDAETRESEILVLQKATIDPHFVPWLKGKDQYNKYMSCTVAHAGAWRVCVHDGPAEEDDGSISP